jgi:recombination protein RecT
MSQELSTKNDLRSFIAGDKFKEQVALSLPSHMTPDRFARVAITAMTRTPKLFDCTRESLLRCLMDCSSLGLEPDGRHAHLIPYKDQCTLIVDYKGLIALARRSGDVAVFRAELVKEGDGFTWENGVVSHAINWREDRGKTQAVYSYVKFKDGCEDWEVMTLAEVDAIRKRSRAGGSGPWVTDFDEMAKKTVIRRHSKRLTLSPEFADALEKDDDRIEERAAKGQVVARSAPVDPWAAAPAQELPQALPDDADKWTDEMIEEKFAAQEMEGGDA